MAPATRIARAAPARRPRGGRGSASGPDATRQRPGSSQPGIGYRRPEPLGAQRPTARPDVRRSPRRNPHGSIAGPPHRRRRARGRRPRRGVLDGPAIGINVPIVTAAVLVGAWGFRRRGRALDPLDAWLPVSALVLAGFVALRADPFVAVLDIAGAAAFTGASAAAFSGLAVTRRSATAVLAIGAWVFEAVFAGSGRAVRDGRPVRSRGSPSRRPAGSGPSRAASSWRCRSC